MNLYAITTLKGNITDFKVVPVSRETEEEYFFADSLYIDGEMKKSFPKNKINKSFYEYFVTNKKYAKRLERELHRIYKNNNTELEMEKMYYQKMQESNKNSYKSSKEILNNICNKKDYQKK